MSKGDETRDRILAQGIDLASRKGIESLSIGDLAKATGMSKSGLYAHFECKEDLQLQVLEAARQRFVEAVIAPALLQTRGLPRLRNMFERWIDWEIKRNVAGCPFVAASHELDDRPGPLRKALVTNQQDWVDGLATAVRLAIDEGHLRDDTDPQQVAFDIYSVFLAFHFFNRLFSDPEALNRAYTGFEQIINNIIPET
jgi:AcrR family transcriptional regulator